MLPVVVVKDYGRLVRTGDGSLCNHFPKIPSKLTTLELVTNEDLVFRLDYVKDIFSDDLAHDNASHVGLFDMDNLMNLIFFSSLSVTHIDDNVGVRIAMCYRVPRVGRAVMVDPYLLAGFQAPFLDLLLYIRVFERLEAKGVLWL